MKFISISLSPNTEKQDVYKAIHLLFSPFSYLSGEGIKSLEQWFRNYFSVSYAVSFNSGRSAFYAILKTLGITSGDEVLLQSFTCVVVPNTIIALGATPIYVDITPELTIDPIDLEKKISKKTKAILVQHTFGIPSNMKDVQIIAKKYKLPIIEDCAHTIGGKYNDKKLGTIGTFGFYSFGRDKSFSSVFGGMAITNNEAFGKKLRNYQKNSSYPSRLWAFQQLMHPIAFSIILPLYNFLSIGKVVLVLLQKIGVLSFPVSTLEKKGIFNTAFVQKMPNALAYLALHQLRRVHIFNKNRETIGSLYAKEIRGNTITHHFTKKQPLLRYPLSVENPGNFLTYLQKKGIYSGKWYSDIIDPKGTDFDKIKYEKGSCPVSEKVALHIVNLPMHPKMNMKDAEYVIKVVTDYANSTGN